MPDGSASNRRSVAYGLLLAALLLGAAAPPFYKLAANLAPIQLSFLISLVGTVGSGALLAIHPGREPFRVYARDPRQLLLVLSWGIGSYTVLVLALSAGTHVLSASLVTVIYRTWPLMLGLLVWPVLGERLGRWEWAGVAVGFAGIVAAYAWGGGLLFPAAQLGVVAFLFVGAFADAFAAATTRKYAPANMLSFVFLCNLIALVAFAGLGGGSVLAHATRLSGTDTLSILFLGGVQNVGLTVLFIVSYNLVRRSGPVALAYLASPFVTFGLDAVLLGEPILPEYWLIAAGVLVGAVLLQRGRGPPADV